MASQLGHRLVYQQAKAAIQRAGYSAGQAVLSQSALRFESALSTTSATYKFDTLVNESLNGTTFVNQIKLNLQDAFVVSEVGFFIANPSSSTATDYRLFTYDNGLVFTGANVANGVRTVYSGNLSLVVNQRTVVDNWDVNRHYRVPVQQQATNAYYATTGPAFQDSNDQSSDGFYPCEPNWVFVGSKKNDFTLQLPAAPAAVLSNSRVVVILRGILAQNVTSVN
jgi:hypothetical protein